MIESVMQADLDPRSLRAALHALRYAKPLDGSPLLHLELVTDLLQAEGMSNSRHSRAWALGRLLQDQAWQQLQRRRPEAERVRDREEPDPDHSLALLRTDFQAGSIEREAWSALYFRFFTDFDEPMRLMAQATDQIERTLRRRIARGCRLLAECLQELEREAGRPTPAPSGLPQPLTRFIGRERELGQIRRLLAQHRMVSLCGPGGIGKSRLAIHLAQELAEDYPDGVDFVELASVEEGRHLPHAVAAAVEPTASNGRSVVDGLEAHFANRRALLILDNCEHLALDCKDLLSRLLSAAPELQLLVTSRERIDLPDEMTWTVPAMRLPKAGPSLPAIRARHYDALRLFSSRAAINKPGFEIDDANAERIARICSRLDGIPLAIELAATRAGDLSLDQLEQRLSNSLDLLRDGQQPFRPQHETLRSSLDWSYDLLSAPQQELLCRLTVFRGGWSVEGAEAVCTGEGIAKADLLEHLSQLASKSLVEVQQTVDGRRYRMLETVRQYAQARWRKADAAETWQRAHLAHFLELSEKATDELRGPEQDRWMARLRQEHANLMRAIQSARELPLVAEGLRMCSALDRYWFIGGRKGEGLSEIRALLEISEPEVPKHLRAEALKAAGALAMRAGELQRAAQDLECSLDLARQLDDPILQGQALNNLGVVAVHSGDFTAAKRWLIDSLDVKRSIDDKPGLVDAFINLGSLSKQMKEYDEASRYYEQGLNLARQIGDLHACSDVLSDLGNMALGQDLGLARARYEESLALKRQLGDRGGEANTLMNLGNVPRVEGNYTEAREIFEASQAIYREQGWKPGVALIDHALAETALEAGDLAAASAHLQKATRSARELDSTERASHCCLTWARLAAFEDRPERALRLMGALYAWGLEASGRLSLLEAEDLAHAELMARERLSEEDARRCLEEGAALSRDEALDYAQSALSWQALKPIPPRILTD